MNTLKEWTPMIFVLSVLLVAVTWTGLEVYEHEVESNRHWRLQRAEMALINTFGEECVRAKGKVVVDYLRYCDYVTERIYFTDWKK